MASEMSKEQQISIPKEEKIAQRWLKMRGIKKPEPVTESRRGGLLGKVSEFFKSKTGADQLVGDAYDLFVEKDELKGNIVRKQRQEIEEEKPVLSLVQKSELVK